MENTLYFSVIALGLIVWFVRAYVLPLVSINRQKREYQSMAQPMLFTQAGETDDEFFSRVERAKARFIDVKNNWAVKQIPVVAIPQNQAFVIDWFGKQYPYSTVGLGQMEYHKQSLEIYILLCDVWSRETGIFGPEAIAAAKGQKPFNAEKIWN